MSKLKAKSNLASEQHSVDSFPFCFTSIGPTFPKNVEVECSIEEKMDLKFYAQIW